MLVLFHNGKVPFSPASMVVTLAYAIGREEANRVEQAHRRSSFRRDFSRRDLVDPLRLGLFWLILLWL